MVRAPDGLTKRLIRFHGIGKRGKRVVGWSAQAENDEAGEHDRDGHEQKAGAGAAGVGLKQADEIGSDKGAESAEAVDESGNLAGDVLGQHLGHDCEERAVWSVHAAAGEDQEAVGPPEGGGDREKGSKERSAGYKEEGPDEAATAKTAVGVVSDDQHENDREEIRSGAEKPDDLNAVGCSLLDDRLGSQRTKP